MISTNEVVMEEGLRIHAIPHFDFMGEPEYTPEGFRIFRNIKLARSGLFEYRALELASDGIFQFFPKIENNKVILLLRPPEAFTASVVKSCEMKPVGNGHPRTHGKMIVPENVKQEFVGALGSNPRFDGEYLISDLIIYDKRTLDDILNGKCEVSIGFLHRKPVQFFTDREYVAEEWIIMINHLAVVPRGRAGPECRLHENEITEPETMTTQVTNETDKLELSRINSLLEETNKTMHGIAKILDNTVSRLNGVEEKEKEKSEKESKAKVDSKEMEEKEKEKEKEDKKEEARENDLFFSAGPNSESAFGKLLREVPDGIVLGWANGNEISGKDHTNLGKAVKIAREHLAARENRKAIFGDSSFVETPKKNPVKLFM